MIARIAIDDQTFKQLQQAGELLVESANGVPLVVMTVNARQHLQKLAYDDSEPTESELVSAGADQLENPENWAQPAWTCTTRWKAYRRPKMAVRRGDIVTVGIEQGPGQPIKRRPAVVVQCDRNNPRLNSAVVAMITSNTSLAVREPTQVLVDLTTPEGKQTGLVHDSAVKCENLYTKLQRDMRKIGIMSVALMQQVDEALKSSLELS